MATSNGRKPKVPRRPKGSAFVTEDTVKLPLWGGDLADPNVEWVEVKQKVTYGDEQRMANKVIDSMKMDADSLESDGGMDRIKIKLDAAMDGPYAILTWGVDWNLVDGDNDHVEFTMDAILALDPPWAREIERVLEDHITTVEGKDEPATEVETKTGLAATVVSAES